jgi:hypothetical protein
MIESSHRRGDSWTSFGERRGISDPARFGLDLERTRADTGGAAGRWCYPSPPMSGSPSIPPKSSQQAAERSQQTHPTTTQDVYSGIPATTHLADDRRPSTGPVGPRSYLDAPERSSYGFPPRLEPPAPRSLPYPQPLSHLSTQQPPPPYLPGPGIASPVAGHPGPLPAPTHAYPPPSHQPGPEPLQDASTKPQRKTKGHVASACVPCKKAHLRFVCFFSLGRSALFLEV